MPVRVKYSASLSSAEIRVLGSGLRVAVKHCAISEVAIVNEITNAKKIVNTHVTRCHITRDYRRTRHADHFSIVTWGSYNLLESCSGCSKSP